MIPTPAPYGFSSLGSVRALAIVHQPDAGPGVFAEAFAERGAQLDQWRLAEQPDPPAPPAGYDALLTFGGAMHVDQDDRHPWLAREKRVLQDLDEDGMPVLGVCLGAQILSEALGGIARRAREPEIGWVEVEVTPDGAEDALLGPLAPAFAAFQWHSYEATPPPGAALLARSAVCPQAYRVGERTWGIQFHAEVSATDAEGWIADYRSDEDAVRIGLDAEALREETRPRIEGWNRLGRELCGRFLDAVRP
jgi:GMP synthase (glutamine-hydrolysing)